MRRIPKVKIPRVSSRPPPQHRSMLLVLDLPDERAALAAAKEMVERFGGAATVTDSEGLEIGTIRSNPKLHS